MSKELLDRVDELGNIIGTTSKLVAHREGHIHRVVAVYVFNHSGQLYLQKVGAKEQYDHSVGGHVVKGESVSDAVVRESKEELGLRINPTFIGSFFSDESSLTDRYQHIYSVFCCIAPKSWIFAPNEEVKFIELMHLNELSALIRLSPQRVTQGLINTFFRYQTKLEKIISN